MSRKIQEAFKSAFAEYVVANRIGEGGSGTVYEVTDAESRSFALKAIDPQKSTSQKLKRFQNEIKFCQQTVHPNIVRVLDTGRSGSDRSFYVMDIYPCTLQKVLGTLKPGEVIPAFSQILDGVEAAHLKSVTHRDLKPQNIMCDPEKGLYVVADFGIADFAEDELYAAVETQQSERLANFQYAAPEQRIRARQVTNKADVYALGLMLNQMFTGEIPQGTQFKKIAAVAPSFSYLDEIVDEMIRQDPPDRPSIADVKKQLIARMQQFVSLQKISELTGQVVPVGTLTDPLVVDPVRAINFDYQEGDLLVTLSCAPNPIWKEEFVRQSTTQFIGMGPSATTIRGAVARVPTKKNIVAQQKSQFEGWIRNANGLYEQRLKREMVAQKRLMEEKLQKQLAQERERQEILKLIARS
jgi:eukaryotic-like serine/threonine-protein kinase